MSYLDRKPPKNWFLYGIWLRAKRGLATNLVITGPVRSGKSYRAMWIASHLDPDWNIETDLIFTIKEFLNTISVGEKRIVVFDETSIEASSRNWFEDHNKVFGMAMTAGAKYQNIMIMTMPSIKFLDTVARALLTLQIHCYHRNYAMPYMFGKTPMGKDYAKKIGDGMDWRYVWFGPWDVNPKLTVRYEERKDKNFIEHVNLWRDKVQRSEAKYGYDPEIANLPSPDPSIKMQIEARRAEERKEEEYWGIK